MKRFATFVWTKSTGVDGGFNFNCMITDLDATASENLRDKVTLPRNIIDASSVTPPRRPAPQAPRTRLPPTRLD